MVSFSLRPVPAADHGAALRIVVACFGDDEAARFVFPRPATRARWMREILAANLRVVSRHGVVMGAYELDSAGAPGKLLGVALWMPPAARWRRALYWDSFQIRGFLLYLRPATLARFSRTAVAFRLASPRKPVWRLDGLAVDPDVQNLGIGSALVREGIARIAGAPVSLSTYPHLERFYARLGFRRYGSRPVRGLGREAICLVHGEVPQNVKVVAPPSFTDRIIGIGGTASGLAVFAVPALLRPGGPGMRVTVMTLIALAASCVAAGSVYLARRRTLGHPLDRIVAVMTAVILLVGGALAATIAAAELAHR